jgi:hypothetical protein
MNIIFRKDDEKRFSELWSDFISDKPFSGLYSLLFLKYMTVYSKDFTKDLSFVAEEGGKCVAIVPLFLENPGGSPQFTYGNSFIRAPICTNNKVEKTIFSKIDELAKEYCAVKTMQMVDPSYWLFTEEKSNLLQKYGYLDASLSTNVVDLSVPEERLFSGLRCYQNNCYKSEIKTLTGNDFSVEISDNTCPDKSLHEEYRVMHAKAAGRVTRSKETFDLQFQMLKEGVSTLFCLKHSGKPVSFTYFTHSNLHAYYGSGAEDPDCGIKSGLYTTLIWEAMKYYKKRGVKYLETGWQQFGPQLFDNPSKKDVALSFFKRGFGGFNIPLMRGVKYYDSSALEQDISEAVKNLKSGLPSE